MIIAVDFDGVLCENKFPEIGKAYYGILIRVRELIDLGCEVILWTSRADNRLAEAVDWCRGYGLEFCAINENAPSNVEQFKHEHPNGTRKVYADYYIDDHNIEFVNKSEYYTRKEMVVILEKELDDLIKKARRKNNG